MYVNLAGEYKINREFLNKYRFLDRIPTVSRAGYFTQPNLFTKHRLSLYKAFHSNNCIEASGNSNYLFEVSAQEPAEQPDHSKLISYGLLDFIFISEINWARR